MKPIDVARLLNVSVSLIELLKELDYLNSHYYNGPENYRVNLHEAAYVVFLSRIAVPKHGGRLEDLMKLYCHSEADAFARRVVQADYEARAAVQIAAMEVAHGRIAD